MSASDVPFDPDLAYRALIEAHRGLSDEESAALNSRLVLALVVHIADHAAVAAILGLVSEGDPHHDPSDVLAEP